MKYYISLLLGCLAFSSLAFSNGSDTVLDKSKIREIVKESKKNKKPKGKDSELYLEQDSTDAIAKLSNPKSNVASICVEDYLAVAEQPGYYAALIEEITGEGVFDVWLDDNLLLIVIELETRAAYMQPMRCQEG